MSTPTVQGRVEFANKQYRVWTDGTVERWDCASRRSERYHWVRIWPPRPGGSTQMQVTAARVLARFRAAGEPL
jgi:hypothetical protein